MQFLYFVLLGMSLAMSVVASLSMCRDDCVNGSLFVSSALFFSSRL